MSDFLTENNSAENPLNLGTIEYSENGVSTNIYDFDSVGLTDSQDWFTVNSNNISEIKVDIYPTGLIGDYYYEFRYTIPNYEEHNTTYVIFIGDGGSFDGKQNDRIQSYLNLGYEPYDGYDDYFVYRDANALASMTAYLIVDQTPHNAEFYPHLITVPDSNGVLTIAVQSSFTTPSGKEETSYVIDISPRLGQSTAMTAETHLAQYGITIDTAKQFIYANLTSLQTIYEVCLEYGVTNDMIAEILESDIPGLTGEIVANYFAEHGIDSTALGGAAHTIEISTLSEDNDSNSSDNNSIYDGLGLNVANAIDLDLKQTVFLKTSQSNDLDADGVIDLVSNYSYSYDKATETILDNDANRYTFNSNNTLATSSTQWSKTTYTYDDQARLIEKSSIEISTNIKNLYKYSYQNQTVTIESTDNQSGFTDRGTGNIDGDGNIVYIEWAWGAEDDSKTDYRVDYTYDIYGNVLTESIDSDLNGIYDSIYLYEWDLFI